MKTITTSCLSRARPLDVRVLKIAQRAVSRGKVRKMTQDRTGKGQVSAEVETGEGQVSAEIEYARRGHVSAEIEYVRKII